MVSHFKGKSTIPVRAGKLRDLTAQALDVKWHPSVGRLTFFYDPHNLMPTKKHNHYAKTFATKRRRHSFIFFAAFGHWIATASYAGEVVLWNINRNNDPSAKGEICAFNHEQHFTRCS